MSAPTAPSPGSRGAGLLPLGIVLAAGALLYAPALGYGYTHYDDHWLLVEQRAYLTDPAHAVTSFGHDTFGSLSDEMRGFFYRPVLVASFVMDTVLGGGRAPVYHATNVGLHLATTAALFALMRGIGQGAWLAAALAAVFCFHPVNAMAVAWIPGRNDSLLALGALGTVWALRAWLRGGGLGWLLATLAGLGFVLFTKESGLALVAVGVAVVLCDAPRPPRGRLVPLTIAVLAVVALWTSMRVAALGTPSTTAPSLLVNLEMLAVYIGKTFVPVGLSVYPHTRDVSPWLGLVVAVVLVVLALRRPARLRGWLVVGAVGYGAMLAPTLVVPPQTAGLEQRLYVPLAFALMGIGEWIRQSTLRPPIAIGVASTLALLLALAVTTALRLPVFADDDAFWTNAVATSPHAARAWQNRAYHALGAGRDDQAEASAREWVALRPDEASGYVVLGASLGRQRRLDEADAAFARARALDDADPDLWDNLAALRQLQGRTHEAGVARRRARGLRGAEAR